MIALRFAFRSLVDGHASAWSVLLPCIALLAITAGCSQQPKAENTPQAAARARADSQASTASESGSGGTAAE